MNRTRRAGIIAVMIVAILLAAVTRDWAGRLRTKGSIASPGTSRTSLASMNSFALALLLGGLRGPLVMFLWTSSEDLKNEKNLEDFDTYVEWIRLLQPEFDTVHIFQMWNKAYNISVQLAALSNKYTAILDALDYGRRVEAERPQNVNMIYQIASIYFDKFGTSQEKNYYKKRVRDESKPHTSRQRLSRGDPGWRQLELDPVLDDKGMLLSSTLASKYPRPANLPANSEWNDGGDLQYLAQYQPFPYGVGAFAFAYNYHKQAQVLQEVAKQFHASLSPSVVDSRPALALKGWSEDEMERGRRLELAALNVAVPEDRPSMELPTANVAPDVPITDKAAITEAISAYDLGARLSHDALGEYERHLRQYSISLQTYASHMEIIAAQEKMLQGDRDYLKAMMAAGPERQKLLVAAGQGYREAMKRNLQIIFHYYAVDQLAAAVLSQGISKADISALPDDQVYPTHQRIIEVLKQLPFDADAEDRGEHQRAIERAHARLNHIPK